MKKNNSFVSFALILVPLILGGCYSSWNQHSAVSSTEIQQLCAEVGELKRKVSGYELEFQILEEKAASQKTKSPDSLAKLEERIGKLERFQEKIAQDLRTLHTEMQDSLSAFTQYKSRLQDLDQEISDQNARFKELGKLKQTLSSLSKAVDKEGQKIHKVRSGDSLEKIARLYQANVEEIKKINHLSNDTIIIGQELKIP